MFDVPLEKQKVIMFIPYVNLFNLLIWINNCYYWSYSTKIALTGALYAFLHFLPVAITQYVCTVVLPDVAHITGYIVMYLAPLMMSFGLIRFQEKNCL